MTTKTSATPKVLVTGGAGFIGSAVIRRLAARGYGVINLDKLTYAACPAAVGEAAATPGYAFEKIDICDAAAVGAAFARHSPDLVVNLAAETHVDRSIDGPGQFVRTNVVGAGVMLEAALAHWRALPAERAERFRFLHLSTDEVFGDLPGGAPPCRENHPYAPSSPYAASKASADHLVRAWRRTYGLPVLIAHATNNYGSFQFPEKLIPATIARLLAGGAALVYGDGGQMRDWLHVDDHAEALERVLTRGRPGESYNVSGACEQANIDVVRAICRLLDELAPNAAPPGGFESRIEFVADRPGHDRRYALDAGKLREELGWRPRRTFDEGLRETVRWCLDHPEFLKASAHVYDGRRLGLGA